MKSLAYSIIVLTILVTHSVCGNMRNLLTDPNWIIDSTLVINGMFSKLIESRTNAYSYLPNEPQTQKKLEALKNTLTMCLPNLSANATNYFIEPMVRRYFQLANAQQGDWTYANADWSTISNYLYIDAYSFTFYVIQQCAHQYEQMDFHSLEYLYFYNYLVLNMNQNNIYAKMISLFNDTRITTAIEKSVNTLIYELKKGAYSANFSLIGYELMSSYLKINPLYSFPDPRDSIISFFENIYMKGISALQSLIYAKYPNLTQKADYLYKSLVSSYVCLRTKQANTGYDFLQFILGRYAFLNMTGFDLAVRHDIIAFEISKMISFTIKLFFMEGDCFSNPSNFVGYVVLNWYNKNALNLTNIVLERIRMIRGTCSSQPNTLCDRFNRYLTQLINLLPLLISGFDPKLKDIIVKGSDGQSHVFSPPTDAYGYLIAELIEVIFPLNSIAPQSSLKMTSIYDTEIIPGLYSFHP